MKWCYIYFDENNSASIGVVKKIEMQARAIGQLTEGCDIIGVNQLRICLNSVCIEGKTNKETCQKLLDLVNGYDACYFRWGGYNKIFNQFLKRVKEKIIVVEVPTFPIIGEMWGKARGRLKRRDFFGALKSYLGGILLQYYYLNKQKKNVDVFVLTTNEYSIEGSRTVNIMNAIDPVSIQKRVRVTANKRIKMLAVANISYWHGFDRIINGLAQYRGEREIEFVIVGNGSELNTLKQLVNDLKLKKRVIFLGPKTGKELDLYFDECDIAVGSLGLHRLGIRPSSLKSREYMARGIPFIMTDAESVEKDSTITPFIYEIPGDESPVNIQDIINWIDQVDMEHASECLRNYAEKKCSWISQMKRVSDAVNEMIRI